eukprot:221875-Rhodomonas_salina.2
MGLCGGESTAHAGDALNEMEDLVVCKLCLSGRSMPNWSDRGAAFSICTNGAASRRERGGDTTFSTTGCTPIPGLAGCNCCGEETYEVFDDMAMGFMGERQSTRLLTASLKGGSGPNAMLLNALAPAAASELECELLKESLLRFVLDETTHLLVCVMTSSHLSSVRQVSVSESAILREIRRFESSATAMGLTDAFIPWAPRGTEWRVEGWRKVSRVRRKGFEWDLEIYHCQYQCSELVLVVVLLVDTAKIGISISIQ